MSGPTPEPPDVAVPDVLLDMDAVVRRLERRYYTTSGVPEWDLAPEDVRVLLDALEAARAAATACSLANEDAELERDEARARADRAEAVLAVVRAALAEAGIVLEALWLAEHDGTALAPATKAGITDAINKVRAALAGPPP